MRLLHLEPEKARKAELELGHLWLIDRRPQSALLVRKAKLGQEPLRRRLQAEAVARDKAHQELPEP